MTRKEERGAKMWKWQVVFLFSRISFQCKEKNKDHILFITHYGTKFNWIYPSRCRNLPRQFFFSKFCHPRRRFWAIIENMISPDHVLFIKFFVSALFRCVTPSQRSRCVMKYLAKLNFPIMELRPNFPQIWLRHQEIFSPFNHIVEILWARKHTLILKVFHDDVVIVCCSEGKLNKNKQTKILVDAFRCLEQLQQSSYVE